MPNMGIYCPSVSGPNAGDPRVPAGTHFAYNRRGHVLAELAITIAIIGLLAAIGYLIAKLVFWPQFPLGTAPLLIGVFTISSVQLFFIGLLGEYIGSIHTQLLRRPLVVERERVNLPPAGTPHVP